MKELIFSLQSSASSAISGYNTENQKLKTDSSCFRLRSLEFGAGDEI
jgi:hypothetical protein